MYHSSLQTSDEFPQVATDIFNPENNTVNSVKAQSIDAPLSVTSDDWDINPFSNVRLEKAKHSYTVRNVPFFRVAKNLLVGNFKPQSGDLVLARIDRLGQHKRIELPTGRRATLYVGDEVILCYADRYAPDQFEAKVPDELTPCSMVAAGGIAAEVISKHNSRRQATAITPLGLLADSKGRRLNLSQYSLPAYIPKLPMPRVIVVVGTSMNAGKTTTVSCLIKGLTKAGHRVAAGKLTGTGAGCDRWLMKDSGACQVLDFTDMGLASTCHVESDKLIQSSQTMIAHLQKSGADTLVLEIADGLLQRDTAFLLQSSQMKAQIDAVLFSAGDALGAVAGSTWLRDHGLPCIALSGVLTSSQLASQEAASATGLPVLGREELANEKISQFMNQELALINREKSLEV